MVGGARRWVGVPSWTIAKGQPSHEWVPRVRRTGRHAVGPCPWGRPGWPPDGLAACRGRRQPARGSVCCARLRETTRGFDPLAKRVGRGTGPIAFPARGSGRLGPQPHDGSLDIASFRQAVLGWFDAHGRHFPFRGTTNPYLVLVSETLLQQTQISRGGPAWVTFTGQFPTVESLAAASAATVLRAWRGLGYNRRAINLHRTARIVVDELGGVFPRDVAGLERLPGIGPYTARAVASIAYGIPAGAVDTNVRRMLGRVLAGDPAGLKPRILQSAADDLVDPDRPDDWTHALMDIGSTLCRPVRPLCAGCPVESICRFRAGKDGTAGKGRAAREGRAKPSTASARPARAAGRRSAGTACGPRTRRPATAGS